ncbi:MAG: type II secretion system protein [Acidobacteriota bacterium]
MIDRTKKNRRGFSLLELLVALFVLVELTLALMVLFDGMNRITRAQIRTSELQQAQRVAQIELIDHIREAGLGGMPVSRRQPDSGPILDPTVTPGLFPDGLAVEIINDVADETYIIDGDDTSPQILTGSDVLVLRGAFESKVAYVTGPDGLAQIDLIDYLDEITPDNYELAGKDIYLADQINLSVEQDLSDFIDALTDGLSTQVIVRDIMNPGAFAILEVDIDQSNLAIAPCPAGQALGNCIRLRVNLTGATNAQQLHDFTTGSSLQDAAGGYTVATGVGNVQLPRQIGSIGVLEELRYFLQVDDDPDNAIPVGSNGDITESTMPQVRLSRARFVPGTDELIDVIDIADNFLDFQVAAGIDVDPTCPDACDDADLIERGIVTEDRAAAELDEILYNHALDDDQDMTVWYADTADYHFIRVNTIVHLGGALPGHLGHRFANLEDADRGANFTIDSTTYNYNVQMLQYPRRHLSTIVELRNTL